LQYVVSDGFRSEGWIWPVRWLRSVAACAAVSAMLLLCAEDTSARSDNGLKAGGLARTFISSPAAAIRVAALDHATSGQQSGSLGGLFNRPDPVGGFAAGFLGAGLFGLLFGHGLLGGLGGVMSYLGLVFQLALIVMLGRVIWTWWSGRNAPAFAGLSPRQLADPYLRSRNELLPGAEALASAELGGADEAATPAVETTTAHGEREA
jgi:hypothetical protein